MSEKAFMIATAIPNPEEQEALKHYQEQSAILFKAAGGQVPDKFKVSKNLYGNNTPKLAITMEFPSEQTIVDVFESEAYKALLPYRNKALISAEIFIGTKAE